MTFKVLHMINILIFLPHIKSIPEPHKTFNDNLPK